uniref:Hint domain-containing protein n=1 Tax=Panagrolaimus sp. PS1159 TaxID=55785 RepID=A0AC35FA78_9BILA
MPNVPFVQNPVNPPAVAADFGNTGYYPVTGSNMACFTGDTEVQTLNGKIKRLDELDVDDWIYSAGDRKFGFTRIISWLHRMPKLKFEFIKITLANGKNLKITKNHYIYKSDCSGICVSLRL